MSDVNRDTERWLLHLLCSNLHRQFSMVPRTGSHQCGGWLLPAPLFYFRPEAHGKAISRPFPVSIRKRCQWFVNRCNVTKSLFYSLMYFVFLLLCVGVNIAIAYVVYGKTDLMYI